MSGLSGHMYHPYDNINLKTDDLIKMAEDTIYGTNKCFEKIDGFGLHLLKINDGNFRIVRSKTDLKNKGISLREIPERFAHNQKAIDFYTRALNLANTMDPSLSHRLIPYSEDKPITYNCEIIQSYGKTNTIPYDSDAELFIHNAWIWRDLKVEVRELDFEHHTGLVQTDPIITIGDTYRDNYFLGALAKELSSYETIGDYYKNRLRFYFKPRMAGGGLYIDEFEEVVQNIYNRMFKTGSNDLELIKINLHHFDLLEDKCPGVGILASDVDYYLKQVKRTIQYDLRYIILNLGQIIIKNACGYINKDMKPIKFEEFYKYKKQNSKIDFESNEAYKLHTILAYQDINPLEGVVVKFRDDLYKWTGSFALINNIFGLES